MKKVIKIVFDLLKSKRFSFFIFTMGAVYAIILFIFAMAIPLWWVNNIALLYPFILLYILFFLNLTACEISAIPKVIKKTDKTTIYQESFLDNKWRHRFTISGSDFLFTELKKSLQKRLFTVFSNPVPGVLLYAIRGRFSTLGHIALHLSFFLLLLGVIVNSLFRFEGSVILPEYGSFNGNRPEYYNIPETISASPPQVSFKVGKIFAKFWDGQFLFTELNAEIIQKNQIQFTQLSHDISIGDASVTISGFGYAPRYVLKDKNGNIISAQPVLLNILAPGSSDFFIVPGYPYKISVSFYADMKKHNEMYSSQSMEPINPAYSLKITRGKFPVFTGVVKPGEQASFEDLNLTFTELTYWGEFRIVSSPGNGFIWAGFIIMILGGIIRLLYYRNEIMVWKEPGADYIVAGSFDHYRELNMNALQQFINKIKSEKHDNN